MSIKSGIELQTELLEIALRNGMSESDRLGQCASLSSFARGDFARLLESLGLQRYGHRVYPGVDRAPVPFEPCAYTYLPPSYVEGMSAVIYDAFMDAEQTMTLLERTLNIVSRPTFDPESGNILRGKRMSRMGAQFIMLNQLYAQGYNQRAVAIMRGDDEAEAAMETFQLAANEWLPHKRAKRALASAIGSAGMRLISR